MDKCPSCAKNSVVYDKNFCEDHLVCTECGVVLSAVSLQHDPPALVLGRNSIENAATEKRYKYGNRHFSRAISRYSQRKPTISLGKQETLKRLEYLSSVLHLNKDMTEDIKEMFLNYISYDEFSRITNTSKIGLLASCTYLIMRQNGYPVTIGRICKNLQCNLKTFCLVYKRIVAITGIKVLAANIDEVVVQELSSINLGDEKEAIVNLTIKMTKVLKSCLYSSGKAPQPIIWAACYLAWKSLHWGERQTTLAHFDANFHVSYISCAKKVNEIQNLFVELASNIPWLKDSIINKNNVVKYIDDIVNYPNPKSLMNKSEETVPSTSQTSRAILSEASRFEACSSKAKDEDISDSEIMSYIRSDAEVVALTALNKRLLNVD